MTWLIAIGLTNALLAAAAFSARWLRRPALAHLLWVLVLCKLLTPPLVKISRPSVGAAGGWLDPASWTNASNDSVPNLVGGEQIARLARQDVPVSCVRWSQAGDRLAVALGRWSEHEQASLLIWSPEAGDVLAQHALSEPAGALDWLADDESLVLAGWDGRGRLWRLDGGPTGWVALSKDAVSAAGWSPDCPLISAWQNEQLARGAESEL